MLFRSAGFERNEKGFFLRKLLYQRYGTASGFSLLAFWRYRSKRYGKKSWKIRVFDFFPFAGVLPAVRANRTIFAVFSLYRKKAGLGKKSNVFVLILTVFIRVFFNNSTFCTKGKGLLPLLFRKCSAFPNLTRILLFFLPISCKMLTWRYLVLFFQIVALLNRRCLYF